MQAVAEKTRKRKSRFPAFLVVILLLLAAACAVYWFILRQSANGYSSASFTAMPVDTAGNNLIGNLPENLQAGGFMAGQNGWYYYANFEDNGALYMCREGGENMVKLTDFPVANINIVSDSLVFTGLEQCYATSPEGVYKVGFTSISDMLDKIQGSYYCWYGGPLYAIYGINSIGNELRLASIEPVAGSIGEGFFFPYFDKDGLFVSSGGNILANKLKGLASRIGETDEIIIGQYIYGDIIYAELRGSGGGRIVRVDAKTLQPLDSLRGKSLYRFGKGFVFHDEDSGFIYQINPGGNEIIPISAMSVESMAMNQLGEITAVLPGGIDILIADKPYYPDIVGRVLAMSNRLILQNGWYNYLAPSVNLPSYIQYPGIFCANGEYYQIGRDGIWLKDGEPVEWLRTPPLKSVTNKDLFTPEESFTPSGYEAGVDENAEHDSEADFGNEVQNDDAPFKPGVFADPRSALDAAVMLLQKDDSINGKYSAESVDALKAYYGDSFDTAINGAAQGFNSAIGSRIGASPNPQTLYGMVSKWLKIAKYDVGNAKINGDTSVVILSTSNVADSSLIYPTVETEVMNRAKKNPILLFKSKDEQAAWALDVLLEILERPEQYNILSSESVENGVTMKLVPDTGWVVDDLTELLRCFARGM